MKYLSAIDAARIIGVNEKTVRLWVKEGKLSALKPARNRLAIPEPEVEQKAREHQMFSASAEQEHTTTTAALSARVDELEKMVATLQNRLDELESHASIIAVEPPIFRGPTHSSSQEKKRRTAIVERNTDLPPGHTLIRDFAMQYGVNPATFRDHVTIGIGRGKEQKDRVEASERPKPGRANETERYLTPEQQRAALAFWDRHGVAYTVPDESEQRADDASAELQGITEPASTVLVVPEKSVKPTTSLYELADRHKMNRNEAVRRFNMGMIRGTKPVKQDSSIMVSAEGMRDFWLQFHEEPGFYTCDDCPHS